MNIAFRPIDSDADWKWMADRTSILLIPDMTSIMAVDADTGAIQACCVMDSWTENSCQIHFAIDNPFVIRHGYFEEISKFVFDTSGREVMIGTVPASNEKALKLDKRIGFKEVTRLKNAFKQGVDFVVLELRKAHCNFNAKEVS